MKNCKRCGKEFEPRHPSREYCSSTCKQYAYFERKNNAPAQDKNELPGEQEKKNEEKIEIDVNPVSEQGVYTVNPTTVLDGQKGKASPSVTEAKQIPHTVNTANKYIPVNYVSDQIPPDEEPQEQKQIISEKNKILPESKQPVVDLDKLEQIEKSIKQSVAQLEKLQREEKKQAAPTQPPEINPPVINKPPVIPAPSPPVQKPETFMQRLNRRAAKGKGKNQFTRINFPGWRYEDWTKVKWVNERLKSHFKKLLFMSKNETEANEIKYLYEKMKEVIESHYFRFLPLDYPYTSFVKSLFNKLQNAMKIIEKDHIESTRLLSQKEDYIEMKVIVFEIGATVPDNDHSTPRW